MSRKFRDPSEIPGSGNRKSRRAEGAAKAKETGAIIHGEVPSREVLLQFITDNPDRASKREIAKAFGLKGDTRVELKQALRDLENDGLVNKTRKSLARPGSLPPVGTRGSGPLEAAEASGALKPGGTIIEPTSGNTGVGLAMVAAVKGYHLVLVMPDSMSIERRRLMLAYGASFVLTPREKGMNGSIARAKELLAETPNSWMPQQFENPANIDVHVRTTAAEIAADFPNGLDALITGVGTGGHITGCAQVLKAKWPKLKVFAVEPSASPVISGGKPSPHPIQGIGAGFIPTNLHTQLLDGVIQVEAEAAREMARRSAREEGLLVGISSGATLAAIAQKLPELPAGATVKAGRFYSGLGYLQAAENTGPPDSETLHRFVALSTAR